MTVNKRLCGTFKEACFAYGLLKDDKEWTHAISEASLWELGPQLRDIFVSILLFCDVSRSLKLWEENWEALSEDILHKKQNFLGKTAHSRFVIPHELMENSICDIKQNTHLAELIQQTNSTSHTKRKKARGHSGLHKPIRNVKILQGLHTYT
ncbi:hypothetical protein Tco_0769943 [Tanacetum coccineum]|uniref:ATP-dependent DNA helicase n=1 Tax=Tanacetum coccineum TaxID=301880 RepID=A0ABQ4ZDR4_9ASTR